jgi:hypothetical protein
LIKPFSRTIKERSTGRPSDGLLPKPGYEECFAGFLVTFYKRKPVIIEELKEDEHKAAAQVTPEVTPEVKKLIAVLEGEMTRKEIQGKLGLKDEKYFREFYQQAGVASGLIEMTIPDKPHSRLQKYRLTLAGEKALMNQKKNNSE